MALYGLQKLGDSYEVLQLVAALTPRVQACQERLDPGNVGMALYGLKGLGVGGWSSEVRELLAVLTPKVQQCLDTMGAREVCIDYDIFSSWRSSFNSKLLV